MSLTTITFDDEYSGSSQEKTKASPKPPPKIGGNPGLRPGFKRPMPKRISSITPNSSAEIRTSKLNSNKDLIKSSSTTSYQKQNINTTRNKNMPLRNNQNNSTSDSDYYYDDYEEESNQKPSSQIKTSAQRTNTVNSRAKLQGTSNRPSRPMAKAQPNQIPNHSINQKKEQSYSDSYSYDESESQPKLTPPPTQNQSQKPKLRRIPERTQSNTPNQPQENINTKNDILLHTSPNVDIKNTDININTNTTTTTTTNNNNNDNAEGNDTKVLDFGDQNIVTIPKNHFSKKILNEPVSYRLSRSKVVSLHGKMTHYQLYQLGRPLLHTKIKSKKPSGVCYVGEGAEVHLRRKQYFGAILFANNRCTFSIRNNNEYGEEIMTILFKQGVDGSPRDMHLFFPTVHKNIPQKLINRKATLSNNNSWTVDMRGKFTTKSIKNCVIVDEDDNEYAYVMKTDKDTLKIEVDQNFTDLMVLSIGISSFFCKL